jgi:phosphoribosyl 1,2-cyclic phosphodiesterase
MTTLYVLGSGSRGNAFALAHQGEVLLIDAGFSAREIRRRAELVGLPLDRATGLVLTHEHGDHAGGAARLAQSLGIPVLCSEGTWTRLARRMGEARHLPVVMLGDMRIGPFVVAACLTSHDAAEPIAVAVSAPDGARLGVAYDLGRPTAAVRVLLSEVGALVLEANHDEVMIRTSDYPASVRQRIIGSGGHLSNRAAAELIGQLYHPELALVVLAHLSERCNSAAEARAAVEPTLQAKGFRGTLCVAEQNAPLPPFELAPMQRGRVSPAPDGLFGTLA